MIFSRTVYLPNGSKHCECCGNEKFGPGEMYEYEDVSKKKIVVCFDCRMNCTVGKSVEDLTQRRHTLE